MATGNSNIVKQKLVKEKHFFISLKWRALLLLSLVLITINVTFYVYHKENLLTGFEHDRASAYQRNKIIMTGLLDQSADFLTQVGEMLPSLYGMQDRLRSGHIEQVIDVFSEHWPVLQFDARIDSIGFYNGHGGLIHQWGEWQLENVVNDSFVQKINNVLMSEMPDTLLLCQRVCGQFVFVPVNRRDKNDLKVIIVGRMLGDIIANFHRNANIDIGFLVKSLSSHPQHSLINADVSHFLNAWPVMLLGLLHRESVVNALKQVASNHRFDHVLANGTTVSIGELTYDIQIFHIDDNAENYIVFIDDISLSVSDITHATQRTLLLGGLGLILSELALLFVLWGPLSRLRQTTSVVPLLAQRQFAQIHQSLLVDHHGVRVKNEIDILDESIIQVAQRLENLELDVADSTRVLAEKMGELIAERDFIKELLDIAQVIILTQDVNGTILLVNQYTESLTGYRPVDLRGSQFIDLLLPSSHTDVLADNLADIATGVLTQTHGETKIKCRDRTERYIAWVHSYIEAKSRNGQTILSVGLDITERIRSEQKIGWLADHDALTGLFNRRRFSEAFEDMLSIANRYNRTGALMFLDLDNFKHINDTQGHQTGDILIRSMAEALKMVLRESDIVGRLGGDEFAVVLPEATEETAIKVAKKICEYLSKLCLPLVKNNHRISASIGIAVYPEHGTSANDLLANADVAMYQAKLHGRGGWHVFSPNDQVKEGFERQVFWKQKIVQALSEDRFVLHYQPIMNISKGDVSHYEVLLRMRDEDGKLIPPGPFIEVAEKTGLIHAIDHLVLHKAINSISQLRIKNNKLNLAINLSAHAFSDPELLPLLQQLLASTGVPPEVLIFEITETAALADLSAAVTLIKEIRQLGCRFALDDFGVGFSSFYYLKELPVDYVKIDGSFIQNLSQNRNDQILVKAMTDIAKELGKKTIAEFVEDAATLSMLQKYQVDYAQGYHIGKPALEAA